MIWCERQGKEVNESALMTDSAKMEKMIKHFKTHRCALDFDHSFCKATFIDLTNEQNATTTRTRTTTAVKDRRTFLLLRGVRLTSELKGIADVTL